MPGPEVIIPVALFVVLVVGGFVVAKIRSKPVA